MRMRKNCSGYTLWKNYRVLVLNMALHIVTTERILFYFNVVMGVKN
jgi:hypothetical protein